MVKMCRDCVNWLEIDPNKKYIECDYDKFIKTKKEQAEIFVPEIFDCQEWESRPK